MNNRNNGLGLALAVCLSFPVTQAAADEFRVDSLVIDKNTFVPIFVDEFGDGNPPPSAEPWLSSGTPSYAVKGAPGPESGGKLIMQTDNGYDFLTSGGQEMKGVRIILRSDTTANLGAGFKIDDVLKFAVIVDTPALPDAGDRFEIRLIDSYDVVQGDDHVILRLERSNGGKYRLVFAEYSQITNVYNQLEEHVLDESRLPDQFELVLEKKLATSPTISAKWAEINAGAKGPYSEITATRDIYNGEVWNRVQVLAGTAKPIAIETVPVPMPLFALLALGLMLFGVYAARRV